MSTCNMDIDMSSQGDSEDNEKENTRSLSIIKKSIFNLVFKVQERFESDKNNYENAINSFTKQADKLSGDSSIQKALHTFAKDVVSAVKKGRRKNAGNILVQNTAKSRRKMKHRGAGPSQQGRPTKDQSLRLQLFVDDEEDIVSHHIPNRKQKKVKHPHSLAAAVAANRAGEKKH